MIPGLDSYLRPFQRSILEDMSRYRIVLKARQCGISTLMALEGVLTSAGLHGYPHNVLIISKTDRDARDVIDKAKRWREILCLDKRLAQRLRLSKCNERALQFESTGYRVEASTQTQDAGRGKTAHLVMDELAFQRYADEIMTSATPAIESNPNLRLTCVSTPNGTFNNKFWEIWKDRDTFGHYSRHQVDIHRAVADGMPVDVEELRKRYTSEQFAQEFECQFIGAGQDYHPAELLREARIERPSGSSRVILGIDIASVVDNTAVVVLRQFASGMMVFGETYEVQGLPYKTNMVNKTLGQERVIHALIEHHNPAMVIMDCTTEASEVLALLRQLCGQRVIHAHVFTQEFKATWVPRLKLGLQDGSVKLEHAKDFVYSSHAAKRVMSDTVDVKNPKSFVKSCFLPSHRAILEKDFGTVHKKMLSTGLTFDSHRSKTGHGDSYWAALLAYYVARGDGRRRITKARAHRRA